MDSSNAEPKLKRLERGLDNLAKHIENIRIFGIEPVVAINRFLGDSSEEIMVVEDFCKRNDVPFAISNCFSEGSAGSLELSERAIEACERPHLNKPLYSFEEGIQVKLERLVTQVYGGKSAEYEPESMRDLRRIETFGFANLPLCVAKTQMSLSDDPKKIGRPTGFTPIVRRFEVSAGAGFVIVDMGDIIAMPGLPSRPASEGIDIDKNGIITGLY